MRDDRGLPKKVQLVTIPMVVVVGTTSSDGVKSPVVREIELVAT